MGSAGISAAALRQAPAAPWMSPRPASARATKGQVEGGDVGLGEGTGGCYIRCCDPPSGMSILDTTFAQALRMFREERLAEADGVCRSLLRLAPNHPDVTHLLAAIGCRARSGLPEAVAMSRRAVAAEIQRPLFFNTLGVALRLAGRSDEAARWFGRALRLEPDAAEPRLNLAGVLSDRRDPGARREMRRALALVPASSEAQNNLGAVEMREGSLLPAMARFARALRLNQGNVEAWRNLSGAACWYGRIAVGIAAARTALILVPTDAEAWDMLANALVVAGDTGTAQACLRRALTNRPDFHAACSNLLFALAYDGNVGLKAFAAAQRSWGRHLQVSVPVFDNDRTPERRIRLGYLSGDLRTHPVGWNVEGLIRHQDRKQVEIGLYSTAPRPDEATRAFAAMADRFRDVSGVGERDVGRIIRDDRVDVLVALAPHTAYNSAIALVEKPAPVVVAFHAIGSTGLLTVDYWVTDEILHPEDSEEVFTESLLRLPCFYLHKPPIAAEPGPAPSASADVVTFGSFNSPAKIGPDVIRLWARILHSAPGSRLLLRHGERFGDPVVGARFRDLFAREGIPADRLILEGGHLDRAGHLAMFDRVDVSLDPFPFNGSTTTFESLWMGVPVVTKVGDRFVGRVGLDVLSRAGLADLAADGDEDYVTTALRLARDAPRRSALRRELRARLAASSLCDAPSYARAFDTAIRRVWRHWCEAG